MAVQTIERTGKRWKLHQAVGAVALAIGIVLVVGSEDDLVTVIGAVLLTIGLYCSIVGRLGAWWYHG